MAPKHSGAKRAARRRRLDEHKIITAAVAYADTHGIDALSMRQLAAELGCGVMSLYNHVADKDDLLDGMVEYVAAEIELPSASNRGSNWVRDLRRCVVSAYKANVRHLWVAKIWGRDPGPAKNAYHETLLRIMREAGLPEELSCRGFHALTMHVVGFSLQVADLAFANKREFRQMGRRILAELDGDEFPYLREHVKFHLDGRDKRNDFKYMLDLILDGLERDFAKV